MKCKRMEYKYGELKTFALAFRKINKQNKDFLRKFVALSDAHKSVQNRYESQVNRNDDERKTDK